MNSVAESEGMRPADDSGRTGFLFRLASGYRLLAILGVIFTPTVAIAYMRMFDVGRLRFPGHLAHEIAIVVAVAFSAFVGWVAFVNYRRTGEAYQRWVALAFISFALVYAPHGVLTRLADTNLPAFLVFGPVSRLCMGIYLLIGVWRFDSARDSVEQRSRGWFRHLGALLTIDATLLFAGVSGQIQIVEVRAIEMASNAVFVITGVAMLARPRRAHLLNYQLVALVLFVQASAAFLLSKPWSHLWWLAHAVSAAGFFVLGYAVMRAYRLTGEFALVFSERELYQRLREHAAELERERAEQARLIDELRVTGGALAQSNRDLEQFAYVASHDLQEPLRMVVGFTDLLNRQYSGRLDDQADKYLAFANDGAQRMQRMVADLLSYSRITTQGKAFEEVPLNTVVDAVIAEQGESIREAGATVTREELPVVKGDAGQIRRAFQNLISNAIKFRGEVSPVIRIRAMRSGQGWRVTVTDNGIGIDPDQFERIFTMFSRLHTREQYPGTGIGLASVKRIAERHGWQISVESAPGRGATFTLSIPDS